GATTIEEYRRAIETDPPLSRRFTLVEVEEPTRDEAVAILTGVAPELAKHHRIEYEGEAILSSVEWSVRYLPGRTLPDKAMSIWDLAGARVRRRSGRAVSSEQVAEVVAELADIPLERLLETDRDRMLALESLLADRVVGHKTALARMATILRRNAAGF